jgi:cephalosporin hydroxylase
MDFPACLTRPNVNGTFAGADLAQTWQDLALWEAFLDRHPVASLVELGTWRGGMAIFLALQCRARGIRFLTAERFTDQIQRPDLLAELGAEVLAVDLHSGEGAARMREILEGLPRPRLLFCDDGDKRLEVRSFGPSLASGDLLAVHDWLAEIGPEDVPAEFVPLMQPECEGTESLTRFFLVP